MNLQSFSLIVGRFATSPSNSSSHHNASHPPPNEPTLNFEKSKKKHRFIANPGIDARGQREVPKKVFSLGRVPRRAGRAVSSEWLLRCVPTRILRVPRLRGNRVSDAWHRETHVNPFLRGARSARSCCNACPRSPPRELAHAEEVARVLWIDQPTDNTFFRGTKLFLTFLLDGPPFSSQNRASAFIREDIWWAPSKRNESRVAS